VCLLCVFFFSSFMHIDLLFQLRLVWSRKVINLQNNCWIPVRGNKSAYQLIKIVPQKRTGRKPPGIMFYLLSILVEMECWHTFNVTVSGHILEQRKMLGGQVWIGLTMITIFNSVFSFCFASLARSMGLKWRPWPFQWFVSYSNHLIWYFPPMVNSVTKRSTGLWDCYQDLQTLCLPLPSEPCDLNVSQKAWHFNKLQTCIKIQLYTNTHPVICFATQHCNNS